MKATKMKDKITAEEKLKIMHDSIEGIIRDAVSIGEDMVIRNNKKSLYEELEKMIKTSKEMLK